MTSEVKKQKYFAAVGRRKEAVARVRISEGQKEAKFEVNGKDLKQYFPTFELQKIATDPLHFIEDKKLVITVKTKGGGKHGQAGAVRLGITRALVLFDGSLKKALKGTGFLTRDSRMKERKKPGLKGARRAPQWSKR
jgi:small subunit ribosomal protein S9